jgi:hypothetical protein
MGDMVLGGWVVISTGFYCFPNFSRLMLEGVP